MAITDKPYNHAEQGKHACNLDRKQDEVEFICKSQRYEGKSGPFEDIKKDFPHEVNKKYASTGWFNRFEKSAADSHHKIHHRIKWFRCLGC
jgi:hypothetical protein